MFKSKTVFVVGAGASKEFGLPIGSELAMQISSYLDFKFDRFGGFTHGDYDLYEACVEDARRAQKPPHEYKRACRAISDALPTAVSIDTYLEVHDGDKEIEVCGKLGIAYSILKAERVSHLRAGGKDDNAPPHFKSEEVLRSWLSVFVRMAQVGVTKTNVSSLLENVTFVIFNYDRSVEHFLFHWMQRFYRIDSSCAAEILSAARFYHPYGVAGELPWQAKNGQGVPFGAEPDVGNLLNICRRIRTYSEQMEDNSLQVLIHSAIAEAKRLVFLGFGFGEQNMNFLTLSEPAQLKRVYGTAFEVSPANQQEFEMRICNALRNGELDVALQAITSSKLLSDHDTVFVKQV